MIRGWADSAGPRGRPALVRLRPAARKKKTNETKKRRARACARMRFGIHGHVQTGKNFHKTSEPGKGKKLHAFFLYFPTSEDTLILSHGWMRGAAGANARDSAN